MTAIHPAFNIQALSLRESNENLDCSNNNETANSTTTNNISGIESTSSSVPGHNTLTKTQTNGSDTSTNTVKIHPHVAGYNFNLEPTQTNKENSTGGEVGFDSDHEMQSSSSTPMETITPSTPALLAQPSWSMEPLAHSSDNFTLQSSKNRDKAYFEDGSKLTQDMPPISSSGPRKALNAEVVELPSVVEHPEYPPFPAPNSQQSRHQHSNSQATSDTYTLQPSILASSNDTISNFPHSVSQPQIYSGRRQMSQSSQGHNRSQSQTNPPITIPPAHSSYVPPQSQPSSSYGFQNYTLQDLVDLDLRCQAALISVQQSRSKMLNTVVQGSVTYRLYAAVNGFFANVSLRESHDANKFANAFQTLLDTSNYLLKDECEIKYSPFSSTLRGHFRRLIESFVTLLKTAPTFVAAALLSMSTSDIENFVDGHASAISEAYPDVSSLNRTRPVDILFYTIFPSDVAVAQREEYFSQLLLPLISHKRGDSICFAVLDRFIDFDGHIYRKGLEFELLQILQSANCILNGKDTSNCKPKSSVDQLRSSPTTSRPRSPALAEQQSTVRPNGRRRAKTSSGPFPTASSQDVEDLKASQIIERAVESLLQYLANVNSSTIPDSLLRIVKHVVSKMDAVKKRGALLFFVVKYFFGQHVVRLITHPERIGILENYYIAPRTRTKVLNAIAQRLQLCVTLYANGTELDNEIIHQYINEIYSRFEDAATHSVSLSPSQSSENVWGGDETFASPGQMVTLAPSDLVCLYTALFPSFALHQRSSSMNSHHLSAKKIRPSAMSYSTSSSISSSTPSRLDETQHAPDVDLQGQVAQPPPLSEIGSDASTSSPSYSPSIEFSPFGPTDDSEWSLEDIKSDLQPVMEELIRRYPYLRYKELSQMLYSLRPSKSQALRVPHPLSEKWQVYRMDDDGTMHELTTDSSCSSSMSGSKRESLVLTEDPLPVPQIYRPQMSIIRSAVEKLARANDATICVGPFLHVNFCLPSEQHMVNLLTACQRTSALNGNYVTSHEYSTALAAFKRLAALPGADSGSISAYIFNSIARAREERIGLAEQQLNEASEQARPQRLEIVRTREKTQDIIGQVGHIRTKIWYNTEVRTSGIWKRARDVSMTLTYGNDYVKQHLSATQKSPSTSGNSSLRGPGAPQLRRNSSTSSIASLAEFTFKRLTRRDSAKRHSMVNVGGDRSGSAAPTVTVVESSSGNSCSSMLMFAPQELAGPFKLNDKESAATTKWLEGQQIQNFCNGEERIHRFCCEIDDLLKRIMGDTMTSRKNRGQSMLSSSALFRSDLWSCIIELEGTNRGSNSQLNLKRASMIDITADSFRGNMHLKGHRSSMSNVLDIFSALDSENLTSSGTLSKFSPVSGGHRRNVSDAGTVASNIWDSEITEQSEPSSPTPETRGPSSAEKEELRNKLEQMLLDVQMTLTGLLYTDLGTSCFGEGKFYFLSNKLCSNAKCNILTRKRNR